HTLSIESERILALAAQPLMTSYKSFNALSDADMQFGEVKNGEGQSLEMTHASYGMFIRSYDRTLRKNAFETLHKTYHGFENTLAELYNGCVQN
ncbi:oligoendopeptidase F, partial [Escherichia coli]|nr:oligoendopeptidase F [Escherichia coli]